MAFEINMPPLQSNRQNNVEVLLHLRDYREGQHYYADPIETIYLKHHAQFGANM